MVMRRTNSNNNRWFFVAMVPITIFFILQVLLLLILQSTTFAVVQTTASKITETSETQQDNVYDHIIDINKFLKEAIFGDTTRSKTNVDDDSNSNNYIDPFQKLGHDVKSPGDLITAITKFVQSIVSGDSSEPALLFNKYNNNNKKDTTIIEDRDKFLTELIESMAYSHQEQVSMKDLIDLFWTSAKRVHEQLKRTFKDTIDNFDLNPIQLYYHMLQEEIKYNSVYKRRQHAFMSPVPKHVVNGPLSDGLYLSQLSYVDDCNDVKKYLKYFHNNTWALFKCTTSGKPSQPAHFIAIRRIPSSSNYDHIHNRTKTNKSKSVWERLINAVDDSIPLNKPTISTKKNKDTLWKRSIDDSSSTIFQSSDNNNNDDDNILEVAIVIRGSKEIADFISDALLESVQYRNTSYKAHNGILESAIWLHKTYKPILEQLLDATGRSEIRLWLIGHSLGAGTAALTCMEFHNNYEVKQQQSTVNNNNNNNNGTLKKYNIDAYSLGFGTPAVVSQQISEQYKDKITTVINDADCVPRMSGITLIKAWLYASLCTSWVQEAKEDIKILNEVLKENFPFPDLVEKIMNTIMEWLNKVQDDENNKDTKHGYELIDSLEQVELIPPGECIHIYRDGNTYQAVYISCNRFNQLESVPHLITDHLIPTGYYRGLLEYIRDIENNRNWKFDPDLMDLPVV